MVAKLTVEMRRCPPKNMMPIAVLYQILLFLGDPILLGGFKLSDEVLVMLVLGAILIGHNEDGDFI